MYRIETFPQELDLDNIIDPSIMKLTEKVHATHLRDSEPMSSSNMPFDM